MLSWENVYLFIYILFLLLSFLGFWAIPRLYFWTILRVTPGKPLCSKNTPAESGTIWEAEN